MAEHVVGSLQRKYAFSFQYVMKVGLGDPGKPGEPALGGSTAAHALAKIFQKTFLQVVKCHVLLAIVLFLTEIGW
jgi:hypothetical protein